MKSSNIETYSAIERLQNQLSQYALLIVATVESLLDSDEVANAPTYEPATDMMTSSRIPLLTSCSSQAKKPWHISATQQTIPSQLGHITEWILKFDCSYPDLFSPTAVDEIKAITFTVITDETNKDLQKIKVEETDKEAIVINLQSNTDSLKRTLILKECSDILTPLLIELESVRHRASLQAALQKSFQKA